MMEIVKDKNCKLHYSINSFELHYHSHKQLYIRDEMRLRSIKLKIERDNNFSVTLKNTRAFESISTVIVFVNSNQNERNP